MYKHKIRELPLFDIIYIHPRLYILRNFFFFFLISKKISLKKCKTPLSTQEIYTGATQVAHMKNPRKPTRNYIPTTPKTHMKPKLQKKPPTNT
jgi:hypothetical protein